MTYSKNLKCSQHFFKRQNKKGIKAPKALIPLVYQWSGSNRHSRRNTILSRARLPIPPHWQRIKYKWCRGPESNRYGSHLPQDFKSCASASSATPAFLWSGRRDSNPRPPPWQGGVLPLNYFRKETKWCG